jgi:hypothetical protein
MSSNPRTSCASSQSRSKAYKHAVAWPSSPRSKWKCGSPSSALHAVREAREAAEGGLQRLFRDPKLQCDGCGGAGILIIVRAPQRRNAGEVGNLHAAPGRALIDQRCEPALLALPSPPAP